MATESVSPSLEIGITVNLLATSSGINESTSGDIGLVSGETKVIPKTAAFACASCSALTQAIWVKILSADSCLLFDSLLTKSNCWGVKRPFFANASSKDTGLCESEDLIFLANDWAESAIESRRHIGRTQKLPPNGSLYRS